MSGKEDFYQPLIDEAEALGDANKLGGTIAWAYYDDPKHVLFTLSRYKFASKILRGKESVIEVGCGSGFASRLLLQEVKSLTATDVDQVQIEEAKTRVIDKWYIDLQTHDMVLDGPFKGSFDGAVSMDVLEHIPFEKHDVFLGNITKSLSENAIAVIGQPSIQSQVYASPPSKAGHVACMTQAQFVETMERHFKNVLIFSMNDEVVHTGFHGMSHYNICVGIGPI